MYYILKIYRGYLGVELWDHNIYVFQYLDKQIINFIQKRKNTCNPHLHTGIDYFFHVNLLSNTEKMSKISQHGAEACLNWRKGKTEEFLERALVQPSSNLT